MKKLTRWLISIVCLLLLTSVQAEIYRWTDEQGNVHFGDRPGADNSSKINIKPQSPKNPKSSPAQKSVEEMANELRESRLAREQKRSLDKKEANREQCSSKQEQIRNLEKEIHEIASTSSRFQDSEYNRAKGLIKQLEGLKKDYSQNCK